MVPTRELCTQVRDELKPLGAVRDTNVVAIYEAGEHEGRIYLAMERVVGDTLRGWSSERPRRLSEVLDVALQAARGLAAAHDAGLVHRDVKPDNIMVGKDDRPRVLDFGLVRDAAAALDARPAEGGAGILVLVP